MALDSLDPLTAPMPAPPVRQFSFTDFQTNNPTAPPPGDRLDAEFDRANNAVSDTITWANVTLNTDGTLRDGIVGENNLQPDLFDDIASDAIAQVQPLVDQAASYASAASVAANGASASATTASSQAVISQGAAGRANNAQVAAEAARDASQGYANDAQDAATGAANAGDDAEGAAALAQDYAVVTQAWAEHMPDPIPPNILAVMGVTGDHWSSRWWANQAAAAFGALTSLYLGAFPTPPTQTPTGGAIPTGAIYYNTVSGQPFVWNGTAWVPFYAPTKAVTLSLAYSANGSQTTFPLTTVDLAGNSYTMNATTPEPIEVWLNGVRLLLNQPAGIGDWNVNAASSTVTLTAAPRAGSIVQIDVLTPTSQLAPSRVQTAVIEDLPTDGVTTTFQLYLAGHVSFTVTSVAELFIALDGVPQQPGRDYNVSGTTITFTEAPLVGSRAWGLWYGPPTGPFPPSGGTITGPLIYTATGGTTPRSAQDRAADVVQVKDFGAVFDGNSHPLSAYYSTLAAAQAVYPHAVALTDEIDGVAIQAAINLCASRVVGYAGGGTVSLPAGTGCVNRPLVIVTSSVSLVGQSDGFSFFSISLNQPSTTTKLRWTGAARTSGQGPLHFLTASPDAIGRINAGSSIKGVLFDCANIAGVSGPLFLSCRQATVRVGTFRPAGVPYASAILTSGSQSITVASTVGIPVGTSIVSASLPEGAYVATIVDGVTLLASVKASATSTETVTIGGEGIRFDCATNIADSANDTQQMDVWFCGQADLGAANATAPLFMIGGSAQIGSGAAHTHFGNTSVCWFHNIQTIINNGAAVVLNNSDHNFFTNISSIKTGAGTGSLIVSNGSLDPNNGSARFNQFGHVAGAGAIKVVGTDTAGFTQASVGNTFTFLDITNGVAYPLIGAGASAKVSGDMFTPALAFLGDDTSTWSSYAISAHTPDSTVRGGNARGLRAVDLQGGIRTAATQVASANWSVIAGGFQNTASGLYAAVAGGQANIASGLNAIALGGASNGATQTNTVVSGTGANADLFAQVVHAGGNIASGRRAQHNKQLLRATSAANTTPVRLTADAAAASTINCCNLTYSDQAYSLSVQLIAIDASPGNNFYSWSQPLGLLRRNGALATAAYVPGTPVILTSGTTTGIVITETADTTNGGYSLTFTPPTGNTAVWRIVATVEWTRVDGA